MQDHRADDLRAAGDPATDGAAIDLVRVAPLLFVAIWATGFLVARLIAGRADPLTFLTIRCVLSSLLFALLARMAGAAWPRSSQGWRDSALAGVLLQGLYLSGVYWSVSHGLPAAVCALITGLQPILTAALAAPMLHERITRRQWTGMAVGLVGASLVLAPQLERSLYVAPLASIMIAGAATIAITLGSIWQKRLGNGVDLRVGASIQAGASAVLMLPMALATESGRFDGSIQVWAGLAWSVLGLSIGGMTLLLMMIARSAVSVVASLFYLVPPVVALLAFAIFGELLQAVQIVGLVVASAGVFLTTRSG